MEHITKAEEAYMECDFDGASSNCRQVPDIQDRQIKKTFRDNIFTYKERWWESIRVG